MATLRRELPAARTHMVVPDAELHQRALLHNHHALHSELAGMAGSISPAVTASIAAHHGRQGCIAIVFPVLELCQDPAGVLDVVIAVHVPG